ncbi:hypothetical protein BVG00_21560 [Bacillus cereus]|uniref:TniQ family protein n=1 Tax=Bacillus cereus TaxID=1396 RepID=UPI00099D9E3C|nr:TniQ family protein [Bacillus cereus]OPD43728.1 hypothetical protein BVG00_21560 [Bacillus cereus]
MGILGSEISVLYSMHPKEIKTWSSESLISYIIRLSKEHNIMVGTLISKLVAPLLNNNYVLNSSINGGNRFYDGVKSLNGFDKNAEEFIRVLELLTGRIDIKSTTLLEIKGLISPRGLLRNNLAWCSVCLEEWGTDAVYYPLIWFFKDMKICVKHNCKLQDICSSCSTYVPILHRKSLIGYCPYCCNWLGTSKTKELECDKALFQAQELSTLLANRALLARKYSEKSISDVFLGLINNYTNGNSAEFARFVNISKVTLWDWVYGGRLPSLGKILDICYRINIPLIQFLIGSPKLDYKLNKKVEQKRAGEILKRRKINQHELQKRLEDFLLKRKELSLLKVSKILGYDRRVLTSNFPEICKLIVNQHKEYCIQQKHNRNLKLIGDVDKAITYLQENEVYPSRREVEKFLNKPGLLHERGIREEWLKKILD